MRSEPAIRLVMGRKVEEVEDGPRQARLGWISAGGARESIEADMVLGADGVWSKVRQALGDRKPPAYRGTIAWRATFSRDEAPAELAGDETGAIYVVTDHRLAAVEADAEGTPVVRWSQVYDRGTQQKTGQLSQGSGTTPTLIGPDLVAITDNAEPRMNVIFYRRTGSAADREVCRVPVFGDNASATENSLAYAGRRSVIVESNFGYAGVQSTVLGRSTTPGIARVDLHRDGTCRVAWTSQVTAPTSVPKVSLGNGLLYVYSKPPSSFFDDSWYFTAIDVRTGATQWMQRTGNGIQWNNHYAAVYLGPDGTAYMPTVAGLIRFQDAVGTQ